MPQACPLWSTDLRHCGLRHLILDRRIYHNLAKNHAHKKYGLLPILGVYERASKEEVRDFRRNILYKKLHLQESFEEKYR